MAKYHYEYRWRCVDLCNGGATRGPYRSMAEARWSKPARGLWQIEKFRVYDKNYCLTK